MGKDREQENPNRTEIQTGADTINRLTAEYLRKEVPVRQRAAARLFDEAYVLLDSWRAVLDETGSYTSKNLVFGLDGVLDSYKLVIIEPNEIFYNELTQGDEGFTLILSSDSPTGAYVVGTVGENEEIREATIEEINKIRRAVCIERYGGDNSDKRELAGLQFDLQVLAEEAYDNVNNQGEIRMGNTHNLGEPLLTWLSEGEPFLPRIMSIKYFKSFLVRPIYLEFHREGNNLIAFDENGAVEVNKNLLLYLTEKVKGVIEDGQ